MLEHPTISIFCDGCGNGEEIELTSLGRGNSWDDRNVQSNSEAFGWVWEGDTHQCPDCADDDEVEQEDFICDGCGCDERDCECDDD